MGGDGLYEVLRTGVHGVDIFCAASGFLIARIPLAQGRKPGVLGVFLSRRVVLNTCAPQLRRVGQTGARGTADADRRPVYVSA